MQRKPGFPTANCSIRMPDSMPVSEGAIEEEEPNKKRLQLINFGHAQWGFNNWSWAVTKQDLDFVDITNGKFTAGVVAFVSITLKTLDVHRENIGYATASAVYKGAAIHNARKCAVTNALRETLLSFGGVVATDLLEQLEAQKLEVAGHPCEPMPENNQLPNKHSEPKNSPKLNIRKDSVDTSTVRPHTTVPPAIKNAVANPPPVGKTHPMPVNLPPANRPPPHAANAPRPPPPAPMAPAPHMRPNSNDMKLEDMSEEEARAERKRRQRLAQEEFRLKLVKQKDIDDELDINARSKVKEMVMDVPSQGRTGCIGAVAGGKRKSDGTHATSDKRRSVQNKLNIIETK